MKKYLITDGNWFMVNPKRIPENPTKADEFFTRDENLAFEFDSDTKADLFFSVSMPLMSPLLADIGTKIENLFVLEIEE